METLEAIGRQRVSRKFTSELSIFITASTWNIASRSRLRMLRRKGTFPAIRK